jgi:hypothetical protein
MPLLLAMRLVGANLMTPISLGIDLGNDKWWVRVPGPGARAQWSRREEYPPIAGRIVMMMSPGTAADG